MTAVYHKQSIGIDGGLTTKSLTPLAQLWRYIGARPLMRAFSSALLPGTGQLSRGDRRSGLVMLYSSLALMLACAIMVAAQGTWGVLAWVVNPRALAIFFFLNLVLVVFRLYAALDAYLAPQPTIPSGAPRASRRAILAAGLVALVLFTVGPHAAVGYYTYASYDLVTNVLSDGQSEDLAEALDDSRLTVLLLGTDAGYRRVGKRADSIMVVSLDLETGKVALFGIPRETGDLPLEGVYASTIGKTPYVKPIGYLYSVATRQAESDSSERDVGAAVLREVASNILGLDVDYYAVVNIEGLRDLIDGFGGVTIDVQVDLWVNVPRMTAQDERRMYVIPAGTHHMDGIEALTFARSRDTQTDFARMGRQRMVIAALLDQTGALKMVSRFPAIASAIKRSLVTDVPAEALQTLVRAWPQLRTGETVEIGFAPPEYTVGKNEQGFYVLNIPLVQSTVKDALSDSDGAGSGQ